MVARYANGSLAEDVFSTPVVRGPKRWREDLGWVHQWAQVWAMLLGPAWVRQWEQVWAMLLGLAWAHQ